MRKQMLVALAAVLAAALPVGVGAQSSTLGGLPACTGNELTAADLLLVDDEATSSCKLTGAELTASTLLDQWVDEAGDSVAWLNITDTAGNTLVVDTSTLVVDATTDRVGIGLTNPLASLHLNYSGTQVGSRMRRTDAGTAQYWFESSTQTWGLYNNDTSFLGVIDVTGGNLFPFKIAEGALTDTLVVGNAGRVGVGTSAPAEELQVTVSADNTGRMRFTESVTGQTWDIGGGAGDTFVIFDPTDAAEFTLTDTALLTISGAAANQRAVLQTSAVNGDAMWQFKNDTLDWGFGVVGNSNDTLGAWDFTAGVRVFALTPGAPASSLFVDGSGRLGVRDGSPDYGFEVVGTSGSGYAGFTNVSDGDVMVINASGDMGLGNATPSVKLDAEGTIEGDTIRCETGRCIPGDDVDLATTTVSGTVVLSTDREATAGEAVQGNDGRLAAATTTATGIVELATDGENAANVVVQGNDSRINGFVVPSGTVLVLYQALCPTGTTRVTPTGGDTALLAVETTTGGGTIANSYQDVSVAAHTHDLKYDTVLVTTGLSGNSSPNPSGAKTFSPGTESTGAAGNHVFSDHLAAKVILCQVN